MLFQFFSLIFFLKKKSNRENVRVLSFGVFVLFMYPGAFVELHTDQLDIITPFRRLRIFSAGVWHNFILVLVSYLLSISLPLWLSPFFTTGGGVLITHISQVSFEEIILFMLIMSTCTHLSVILLDTCQASLTF